MIFSEPFFVGYGLVRLLLIGVFLLLQINVLYLMKSVGELRFAGKKNI